MNYWLRLYTSILNDPKVQRLSGDHFKGWINLLCLAKEHDGILPELPDIAFALRITDDKAKELISALQDNGLIETKDGRFTPHNWERRQYTADVSTERVKRFREKQRNGDETGMKRFIPVSPETESNGNGTAQSRAEAEAEQRQRQQQKQKQNGFAAAAQNEPHKSAFSLTDVRRYVDALKRHATNPGGLARALWRSGEEDAEIKTWLDRGSARAGVLIGPNDDFSLESYIQGLIERGDTAQLTYERDSIASRGGPSAEWEHQVYDYFKPAADDAA